MLAGDIRKNASQKLDQLTLVYPKRAALFLPMRAMQHNFIKNVRRKDMLTESSIERSLKHDPTRNYPIHEVTFF